MQNQVFFAHIIPYAGAADENTNRFPIFQCEQIIDQRIYDICYTVYPTLTCSTTDTAISAATMMTAKRIVALFIIVFLCFFISSCYRRTSSCLAFARALAAFAFFCALFATLE